MIYVFLDTNIYGRVLTQGVPGCEISHIHKLRELIEGGRIWLLLPEVVELEFEAFRQTLKNETNNGCDILRDQLKDEKAKKEIWNEVFDVRAELLKRLEELRKEKHGRAEDHSREIESLLKLDGVARIPLTPEIIFRAKKRLIAKRMPSDNKSRELLESDAFIVESLTEALRERDTSSSLFFCSENVGDFGLDLKEEGIVLHPKMKIEPDMPKAVFRTTLSELLSAIDEHVLPPEPKIETVEQAIDRERRAQQSALQAAETTPPPSGQYIRLSGPGMSTSFGFGTMEVLDSTEMAAVLSLLRTQCMYSPDVAELRLREGALRLGQSYPAFVKMILAKARNGDASWMELV